MPPPPPLSLCLRDFASAILHQVLGSRGARSAIISLARAPPTWTSLFSNFLHLSSLRLPLESAPKPIHACSSTTITRVRFSARGAHRRVHRSLSTFANSGPTHIPQDPQSLDRSSSVLRQMHDSRIPLHHAMVSSQPTRTTLRVAARSRRLRARSLPRMDPTFRQMHGTGSTYTQP